MKCPNCNKFVSYDEPQAEVQSVEVDSEAKTIHAAVTVSLNCQECGEPLKDAEIEAEVSFQHECKPETERPKEQKPNPDYMEDDEQFEVENDGDAEGTSRMETKDRHGKPIKLARYIKIFYGFTLETELRCLKCGEVFVVSLEGEEQASSFNEC
jgi:hypothetical protein